MIAPIKDKNAKKLRADLSNREKKQLDKEYERKKKALQEEFLKSKQWEMEQEKKIKEEASKARQALIVETLKKLSKGQESTK